eukprot:TRINITY_DN2269_c0_g1_i1.p1 TRINITY_DN2269_c0_g1~~TRINITY_DN2269_c0_g1_i1.p1  ORF type:complete len:268 (-),score=78.67 TRINITY_DN2269_c0_g1_i1:101-904(-)
MQSMAVLPESRPCRRAMPVKRAWFAALAVLGSALALTDSISTARQASIAPGFVNGIGQPAGSPSRDSLVARQAKKKLTWPLKWKMNTEYRKRNPRPAMTKSDLFWRLLKVRLFRRQDEFQAEKFIFNDPRDDKYQWGIDKVRQYLDEQATLQDPIKTKKLTSREDLGLPPPPTDLKLKALGKMRGGNFAAARKSEKQAEEEKKAEKQPPGKKAARRDEGPDLTMVDAEFMDYKGLVMTKKQKASMAARAAKAKKAQAAEAGGPKRRR